MSTDPGVKLNPAVAAVAAAVSHDSEGNFFIPPAQFVEFSRAFAEPRPHQQRVELATHLLALVVKYERVDQAGTAKAVAQLSVLVALAAGASAGGSAAPPGGSVSQWAARAVARAQGMRAKALARGRGTKAGPRPPKASAQLKASK